MRSDMSTYVIAAIRKIIVLGAVIGCLLVTEAEIFAQARSWSSPIQLSPFWMTAAFPDIATDSTGRTHVVWSSADDAFDTIVHTSTSQGETWSEAKDIFAFPHNPGESYVTRPVLSISEQGEVYLGIHGVQDKQYLAQTMYDTADIPRAWHDLQMETSGYHVFPLVAENGKVHVVYTSGSEENMMQRALHLYYMQYDDNRLTWSEPVNVSIATNMGAAKPSILMDKENTLHAVWEEGIDGDRGYVVEPVSIMYSQLLNDGSSWSKPIKIDIEKDGAVTTEGRNPAIGLDVTGKLVLVWWSMPDNQVNFRISKDQGRSWSQPQPIPGVWGVGDSSSTRQDTYSMATDSAGNLHLVMVGRQSLEQSGSHVMHLVWDGSNWLPPEVVATYQDDLPEWPRLSIGLGNQLHLVWHVRSVTRSNDVISTSFQIWYAHRILNSPGIEPATLPESSYVAPQSRTSLAVLPTPTPVSSKLVDVQLDPSKKQRPQGLAFSQSLQTENDEVLLLLIAVLPIAAIVGLAALVVGIRKITT